MLRSCLVCTAAGVGALMLASPAAPIARQQAALSRADWTSQASKAIASAEYQFAAVEGGGWSAPNRSQGLRLKADSSGAQIVPRAAGSTSWSLSFELRAV